MFTVGRDGAGGALTLRVDAASGPVRIVALAPGDDPVPSPGTTLAVGDVRILALPGLGGRTVALALGVRGRTVLWAPPTTDGRDRLAPSSLAALDGARLDAVVIDLFGAGDSRASELAALRRSGAVSPDCDVVAVGLDGAGRLRTSLAVRLLHWGVRSLGSGGRIGSRTAGRFDEQDDGRRPTPPQRTLILGPAASGKSALAEELLAAEPEVLYLATGAVADETTDPDWAARVERHRQRRPATWSTHESIGPAALAVLARPGPPVLLDSVGSWVTATLDACGAWTDTAGWGERWAGEVTGLVDAWRSTARRVVAVAEETGWGVVPQTASGRLFRDRLGEVTRLLADGSEQCLLVVAGRVLDLDPVAGDSW